MAEAGDELAAILADCLERRLSGEVVDRDALMARHPELADRLRSCFTLSDFIDETVEELGDDLLEEMPETIDEYQLVREIGRGGMGVVYEAIQVSMERRVALKVLSRTFGKSKEAVQRFRREVRVAGRLHHPNIVPIYATGRYQGLWYYAMELVDGMPLQQLLTELGAVGASDADAEGAAAGPSTPEAVALLGIGAIERGYCERIANLFAGVAEALEVAHENSIVHRDIKPSNLLLDTNGVLRVVDFGLAQLGRGGSLTQTGMLLGTPTYMSPEQAMAKRLAIDHRTDVYSLGATLYEALTLRPPYSGDSVHEICTQIVTATLPPPRRLNRSIPADLETIVIKAMEKDRSRRYATAGALAADLRRFALGAEIRARRPAPVGRLWRGARRHRTGLAVGALVLGVAVLGWGLTQGWWPSAKGASAVVDAQMASEWFCARGTGLMKQRDPVGALAAWRQAIKLDPTNERAYMEAGSLLRIQGRFDEALAIHDDALRVRKSHTVYRLRAEVLFRMGRLEDAFESSSRALELYPGHLGIYRQRVRLLLLMGKYEGALADCRHALDTRPQAPQLRYLEVTALRALGRTDEARDRSVDALACGMRHKYPQHLAYHQAVAGLKDEAVKTLAAVPKYSRTFLTAIVYAVLGDEEALRRWLEISCHSAYAVSSDDVLFLDIEPYTKDPEIEKLLVRVLSRLPARGNRRPLGR